MQKNIFPLLVCPSCGSHVLTLKKFSEDSTREVKEGVVVCHRCSRWYPIENYLLEFLPDGLMYWDDRKKFFLRHKKFLKKLGTSGVLSSHQKLGRIQQTYFDWYSSNSLQSYSTYAASPFWRSTDVTVLGPWRQMIQEHIHQNAILLDVGCAQGRSTFQFADLPIQIVGFDISKKMITEAIRRYRKSRYRARATFIVADASTFPFRDAQFDYVLLYGVLHHLPDPQKTVSEIMRVLRRGGWYFGLENNKTPVRVIFDLAQRLRPLWYERAGSMPLISKSDLYKWLKKTHVQARITTRTFLPPHFVNLFPLKVATKLLTITDYIGSRIPYVRDSGGLLDITMKRL